jgi:RNA polymerase sigma factor (TIGR02999 family)
MRDVHFCHGAALASSERERWQLKPQDALANTESEGITVCLGDVSQGRPGAEERLFGMVYNHLRRMAGQRMRGERPGHTLEATALANEVYMRLVRTIRTTPWKDRSHFYATCALTMRNILIDHARKGKIEKVDIDLMPGVALTHQRSEWLMSFDETVSRLALFDPRGARIVELAFFMGLTHKEMADLLGVSTRTVRRDLDSCMLWIGREMASSIPAVEGRQNGTLV